MAKRIEAGVCPLCGSNISYGAFTLFGGRVTYDWLCPDCEATGQEGYSLVFDGIHYDVRRVDGTEVDVDSLLRKEV